MLRWLQTVLAAEGLVMSWRTYRRTRSLEERREHGDQTVKDAVALTPQAKLFQQVPNPLAASWYFGAVLLLSVSGLGKKRLFRGPLATASWISLGISVYLVYQLLFVLKRSCPMCMRSHALNLALTLVTTAQAAVPEAPYRR